MDSMSFKAGHQGEHQSNNEIPKITSFCNRRQRLDKFCLLWHMDAEISRDTNTTPIREKEWKMREYYSI